MIRTEKIENGRSEIEIKITVPWKEWEHFIPEAAQEISKDVKIKGFRPGKAPKNLIEQRIGKGVILEEAAKKAIQKTYAQAVEQEKIEALGSPRVEITKLAEGNDLEYKAQTAIMPEIKLKSWKKDIRKISDRYRGKKVEITEDEVKKETERLANSRVKLITVDREAKKGDSVEIDFQVKRDNVPIENGSSRKHMMVLGSDAFIPGFEDNIVKMKAGEEKDFELEFPKEYHEKSLAGKPATFNVKVNLVQERQVPEINDDFVKSLGKFKTVKELKDNLRSGLTEEKNNKQEEDRRADYLDKLIGLMEIEIPQILIDSEIQKIIEEFKAQIQGMGMDIETYLGKMKKNEEDLKKEWIPQAEKRIKSSLALEQIAKDMEIKVSSEDIEKEMNKTLQYYKTTEAIDKNIDTKRLYNYTKGVLQNKEVFRYMENIK